MQTSLLMPKAPAPTLDLSRIAQDLQIRKVQVESVVQLLDEGNTVPFITRYRKERTGGLNEEVIRQIQLRVGLLRQLAERKQTILRSIEGQGKLTDELRDALLAADTSKRLEDLYLPYKPKKRTLATVARERGLEALALALWNRDPAVANLPEVLATMVNPEKELPTPAEVLLGAQHILAEQIAETADVRAAVRSLLWETAKLTTSKSEHLAADQGLEYKDYFQFTEPVRQIPPHRILAINRGEKEGALKARVEWDIEAVRRVALDKLPLADHPHAEFLRSVTEDALTRLLLPSLEREIRRELTDEAEEHAVRVFARNLRSLLLQPPLHGRRVLAIDPGFRTGCKIAALDEIGNLLEDTVIFPFGRGERGRGKGGERGEKDKAGAFKPETPVPDSAPAAPVAASETPPPAPTPPPAETQASAPPAPAEPPPPAVLVSSPREDAKAKMEELIGKHQLNVIAIGNGTACRETEELVSELINAKLPDLAYVIVNEAGASVYSASAIGREEFPTYDATLRGTISIGRRLQDPLSELVKVDPQSIGVGLYQHDLSPRRLKDSLEAVIESCVNHVGVDLNTASVPLLRHVSGLNQLVARELVDYRKKNGPFRNREQLLQVPNVGPARYVQAAGFLKIIGGDNTLDQTWIHPESYAVTQRLLTELGCGADALQDRHKTDELQQKLQALSPEEVSNRLEIGIPTLRDILESLARPGRDPREDLPPPIFKKGILKLEDLQPGMELKGTVLNVVDFGAFVDVGLKDSGLVHISQMANRYIKNPYDVVAVGDVVTVWVLAVDQERRRVSLTMIKPGTERKPPERKPPQPRPQRGSRPPRGRRPAHAQVATPATQAQAAAAAGQEGAAQTVSPAAASRGQAPAARAPAQPQRPRKPQRALPKPKLSKDALEGAAPLRTFSELKAFFEAKQKDEPPPSS
ncbi:MAG: RNA-binding transcriptional accessory protein [Gemmataceae bacterium]|nr:RNA-binding transcriptional accessory protein [Gemmataceae bacterium]